MLLPLKVGILLPLKSTVRGDWDHARSGANYFPLLRQDPTIYSIQCPMSHGKNKPIPSPVWVPSTVTSNLFVWFFPLPWVVSFMCVLINSKLNTQWGASADLSSLVWFSSFPFCPMYFSCYSVPGFSALSLQLKEFARLYFNFSFLSVVWKVCEDSKLGLSKGSSCFFSFLRDYCSLLYDA